jgi:hypothetical protein
VYDKGVELAKTQIQIARCDLSLSSVSDKGRPKAHPYGKSKFKLLLRVAIVIFNLHHLVPCPAHNSNSNRKIIP